MKCGNKLGECQWDVSLHRIMDKQKKLNLLLTAFIKIINKKFYPHKGAREEHYLTQQPHGETALDYELRLKEEEITTLKKKVKINNIE